VIDMRKREHYYTYHNKVKRSRYGWSLNTCIMFLDKYLNLT